MTVTNDLVSLPLKTVFSPSTGFAQLHNAVSRLQVSVSKSSPDEATCAMLTACCSSGHTAWIADYLHEICGDSNLSSTNLEDMAVMNGDCVESWLLRATGELINEMSVSSALANSSLVAKLLGRVICLQGANDALKSLKLSHGGVPSDKLHQCHQLLSALAWMSMHGVNCAAVPDLDTLRQSTELTLLAGREAVTDEHATLQLIRSLLPPDSSAVMAYPFQSLLQCLQTIFLTDPSGDEVSAPRSRARVHLLLYYLWRGQITCDWEGLASALGVPADQARGWHAVAMLEHVLGQQLQHGRPPESETADAAAVADAVLRLSTCQHHDMRLYAAELLVALKQPRLALQQAQRCCHVLDSAGSATSVAVPVMCRMVNVFLDLDDAHAALNAARRASKDADTPVREGLLDLFAQWSRQVATITRFAQLPFTIQEEEFFKRSYPDLWRQVESQATRGHAFWRSEVGAMAQPVLEAQQPQEALHRPESEPHGGTPAWPPSQELSFETSTPNTGTLPSGLLFQLGDTAQHKRLRHV
eukprot:jgi/Ulvmu1/2704/UM014_0160.1